MSVNGSTLVSKSSSEAGSRSSNTPVLTTTNYGNIVGFNNGTISNYFVLEDVIHPCALPFNSSSSSRPASHLYAKIEAARTYHKHKDYVKAKILLYEVLHASDLPTDACLPVKYDLARAHFAQSEFSEASKQFEEVFNAQEEQDEVTESNLGDSQYWLARSLFYMERYEDASMHLQIFVLKQHDIFVLSQEESDARQVTKGRLWLGLTFERLEHYDEARNQMNMALELCVKKFGPEHLETLANQHHLANFLYKRRDFYEAHKLFQRVLDVEERLSGPERAEAIKTRCMLALCLAQLGRYHDAEPHLQRVLSHINSDPTLISNELGELGLVYYWLGRIALKHHGRGSDEEAGSLFCRALASLAGNKHLEAEFTDCQMYLAQTMNRQGQFAGAEHRLREIIPLVEGSRQGDLVAIYHGIACNLIAQNKLVEAKVTLEQFVSVETPIELCKHTGEDLASCLFLLGKIYKELKRFRDARDCFQRVVDVAPIAPNVHHNQARYFLGIVFYELREFEHARKHLQVAYEVERQQLRTDSHYPKQAWLGWTLCELELFDEAESNITPMLTSLSQPDAKPSRKTDFILGRTHYYLGRIAMHRHHLYDAAKLFKSALPMIARRFKLQHHLQVECRYHLACVYMEMGRHGDARQIFQELSSSEYQHVVVQDICTILVPYWLSHVSWEQRNYEDAEVYIRKALKAWVNESSYQGIFKREALMMLARCLEKKEEMEACRELMQQAIEDEPPGIDKEGEWYANSRYVFARSFYNLKRYEEACETFKFAIPALEARYGYDNLRCSLARAYLADCLGELERFIEAEPLAIHAAAQQIPMSGARHCVVKAIGSFWLGRWAFNKRKFKEAEERLETARVLWGSQKTKVWDGRIFDCRQFLARIHHEEKRYNNAQVLLRELTEHQYEAGYMPEAVDSQFFLATSLEAQKKSEARAIFRKIIDDGREGKLIKHAVPASQYHEGNYLYYDGDFVTAKTYFELTLKSPLEFFYQKMRAQFYLARTLHQLGVYDEAITRYQSVVELKPANTSWTFAAEYFSGRCYIALNNWPDARIHLQRGHDMRKKGFQNESDCQYFLGKALFVLQDYVGAKSHFQSLCDTPGNLSTVDLDSDYYLGCCLLELGELKSSRRILLKALKKIKEDDPNQLGRMVIRFQLARGLRRLDRCTEAESELEIVRPFFELRSADEGPTLGQVEYELGLIASKYWRWERAADLFQQALLRHETEYAQHSMLDVLLCKSHLGEALFALGRYEEAMHLFRQVFQRRKDSSKSPHQENTVSQMHVGRALGTLTDFTKASPLVKQALEWEGKDSGSDDLARLPIRLFLGEVLHGLSDFEQAVELFSKVAIQVQEIEDVDKTLTRLDEVSFYALFSHALYEVGRGDEARDNARKSIELNETLQGPGSPVFDTFPEDFRQFLQKIKDTVGGSKEPQVLPLPEREQLGTSSSTKQPSSIDRQQEIEADLQLAAEPSPQVLTGAELPSVPEIHPNPSV
ncbi:hypothetical protein Hte_008034 [Hypoxylon texense]